MTTSPYHTVKVRDGKGLTRVQQGTAPGQFEMTASGVILHGKNGLWTFIPYTNIVIIEPTT